MKNKRFGRSVLENIILGGVSISAGLNIAGCPIVPLGVTPRDGIYQTDQLYNGPSAVGWPETIYLTAEVRDSSITFITRMGPNSWACISSASCDPENGIPISRGYFSLIESNVVGDPCTDCDCPQEGTNILGYFTGNETFQTEVNQVNYCHVFQSEVIHGKWISELTD